MIQSLSYCQGFVKTVSRLPKNHHSTHCLWSTQRNSGTCSRKIGLLPMQRWKGGMVLHIVLIVAVVFGRGNLEAEAQDAHQADLLQNTSDGHDIYGHPQHVQLSNSQSVHHLSHSQHNHSHFAADEEQQSHPPAEQAHSHSASEGNHSHSAAEHDHSKCGHNTAVAPWMHQQLLMFDTAKEAADAISETSVKAATGDNMPPVPAEIRIHTDFQLNGIEDVSKRNFLKRQLVPRMVAEIRRRIHVKVPVQGNMKIPRYCAMYYVREDGSYACAKIADQDYCSSPEIGIRHNMDYLDGFTLCDNTNEDSCDAYSGGAGVADSDFVLYVAANEVGYCEHGHIVAFAGTCALDLVSNRPLAGFANFCPGNIDTDPAKFQDLLETGIHEALHALFFSELLFPYFIDGSSGERRMDVVKVGTDGSKMVVTPGVRQAARDHFGCDTLEGALLENEGGDGTAGNHWESKVFKGELMDGMSGAPNERAVFSAITLALIDDTGWYNANWNLQGRLGFGRNAGCNFVSRECSSRNFMTTEGPQWFCPTGSRQDACSWDLKSVGQCSSEQLLDGCSTTVAYRNMHCQKAALQAEREDSNSWLWGYGYGPNSRCMREIGPLAKLPGDGYKYTKFAGSSNLDCYKFTCHDGLNLHLVVGEHEVPCPSGQDVDLRPLGYVSGILGPCPDNQELCSQLSCPNLCSGNGDCYEGECYCALGFAGDDCSQWTCLRGSCPDGLKCNTKAGICEPTSMGIKTKKDCPAAVFEAADWESVYLLMGISSEDFSHCHLGSFNKTTMESLPPSIMELEPPPIDLGSSYGAEWGDEEPLPGLNIGQGGSLPPSTQGREEKPQLKPSPSHSMPSPPLSPPPLPGASSPLHESPSGDDTALPDTETAGPPGIPSLSEDPSKEDLPEIHDAASSSVPDPLTRGKLVDPDEANEGPDIPDRMPVLPAGEVVSERADAQLQLVQLDGDRPMSTVQAENLKTVLARAAGVGIESISFTELQLPTMEDDPYVLDVRIDSSDAARVITSLRNADSYGILLPKIRDEVKMEFKSLDFNIQDESDGGALGWAIGIGILTAVLLGGLVSCLLLCGTSGCFGSSQQQRNMRSSRGKASGMKAQEASAGPGNREAVPYSNRRIMRPTALEEQGRDQQLPKGSAAAAAINPGSHLRGEPSLTNDLNHGSRLEPSSATQIEDDSTTLRSKYQRDFDPGEDRPQCHDPDETSSRHREKPPPSSSTPCAAGTGKSQQRHHHQGHSRTARVGEKPRSPSSAAKGYHARSPATL